LVPKVELGNCVQSARWPTATASGAAIISAMGGLPFPRNTRAVREVYSNPEYTFHVVVRAMPNTTPFRDQRGPPVWELIVGEASRTSIRLLAACLMPDHLHAIVKPADRSIIDWVRSFKSYSTRVAWDAGGKRALWQPGFYDRRIRDETEYLATVQYVLNNPAEANLKAWPWTYERSEDR
jgi:REP element-mobilizing transposase RayT